MAAKTRTNRKSAGGKGGRPYNTTNKTPVELYSQPGIYPRRLVSLPVGVAQEAAAAL